jgi:hypothetical protein
MLRPLYRHRRPIYIHARVDATRTHTHTHTNAHTHARTHTHTHTTSGPSTTHKEETRTRRTRAKRRVGRARLNRATSTPPTRRQAATVGGPQTRVPVVVSVARVTRVTGGTVTHHHSHRTSLTLRRRRWQPWLGCVLSPKSLSSDPHRAILFLRLFRSTDRYLCTTQPDYPCLRS